MTDEEIIKALEICVYGTSVCEDCKYNYSDDCQRTMMIDVLDLISRQKAEIERVREEAIKQFGKMLIDKAERGIIHADDIPDYVVEMAGD